MMDFDNEIDILNVNMQAYIDKLHRKKRVKYMIKNGIYLDILNVFKREENEETK